MTDSSPFESAINSSMQVLYATNIKSMRSIENIRNIPLDYLAIGHVFTSKYVREWSKGKFISTYCNEKDFTCIEQGTMSAVIVRGLTAGTVGTLSSLTWKLGIPLAIGTLGFPATLPVVGAYLGIAFWDGLNAALYDVTDELTHMAKKSENSWVLHSVEYFAKISPCFFEVIDGYNKTPYQAQISLLAIDPKQGIKEGYILGLSLIYAEEMLAADPNIIMWSLGL